MVSKTAWRLVKRKRRLEITVETFERVVFQTPGERAPCVGRAVTPEEVIAAARLRSAGSHSPHDGWIHFWLSPEGLLFVCINSHWE